MAATGWLFRTSCSGATPAGPNFSRRLEKCQKPASFHSLHWRRVNISRCSSLAQTGIRGTWYRAVDPRFLAAALSTLHTATTPSRFSPARTAAPAFEIPYLAENPMVALFEARALFGSTIRRRSDRFQRNETTRCSDAWRSYAQRSSKRRRAPPLWIPISFAKSAAKASASASMMNSGSPAIFLRMFCALINVAWSLVS